MAPSRSRSRREFPLWLLAVALLGVLLSWRIVADAGYTQIFNALVRGVWTTLWVTLVAFALAATLGLIVAMLRTSRVYLLRQVATFYIEVVRGIPVLVLLFYMAFVGAPFFIMLANMAASPLVSAGWMPEFRIRDFDFTWRAIIALTIAYSAFIAEIFRAGIEAVDDGQIEAAEALGLSRWHIFRLVIAPQAFRIILPPLGNDFVAMLKDSALVSALGVQDITQIGKVYSSGSFKFFETYNVVAFLYLVMTISLSLVIRATEHWLSRHRN
ncbi:MAG: Amino acid transporter, permease protein [Devosia sp.]|nr:Amino acid transporter, permease protein [Devosia sp.]